jgi:branched-chain amino acid transport system substrate-binding protein
VGRRAAEKLVLGGSKLLVGTISSAVGLSIGAQVERWDALYLSSINKSNQLTGEACNPRMFRANHSDAMDMAVVGPWLKGRKEKGWVIIAADYAWGRDSADEFAAAAAAAGKTVKGKFFAPLGTKDYAPYIQQIKDLKPDGMWVAIAGRDAVNFGIQAGQFGLLKSVFAVGQSFAVPSTISGMGETANGVWGIVNYTSTIDTPGNKAFVADWMKVNGKEPANFEAETYVAMKLLFAAIAKAGSSEPGAVAKALETTSVDIPFYGQVSMRAEDHQLRMPNFMGRVAKVNGELKLVVEQTVGTAQAMPAPAKECKMPR